LSDDEGHQKKKPRTNTPPLGIPTALRTDTPSPKSPSASPNEGHEKTKPRTNTPPLEIPTVLCTDTPSPKSPSASPISPNYPTIAEAFQYHDKKYGTEWLQTYLIDFHQYDIWDVERARTKGHFGYYKEKFLMPEREGDRMEKYFKDLIWKAEEDCMMSCTCNLYLHTGNVAL
jgi:hypothetical protein